MSSRGHGLPSREQRPAPPPRWEHPGGWGPRDRPYDGPYDRPHDGPYDGPYDDRGRGRDPYPQSTAPYDRPPFDRPPFDRAPYDRPPHDNYPYDLPPPAYSGRRGYRSRSRSPPSRADPRAAPPAAPPPHQPPHPPHPPHPPPHPPHPPHPSHSAPPAPPLQAPSVPVPAAASTDLAFLQAEVSRLTQLLRARDVEIAALRTTTDPPAEADVLFTKVYFPRCGLRGFRGREDMIESLASAVGAIRSQCTYSDRTGSREHCDVWVNFSSPAEAQGAIARMEGARFGGLEMRPSLARFQGTKEKAVNRFEAAAKGYGVGGVYRPEDLKAVVNSDDAVPDLYASFYGMCSAQAPPIALLKMDVIDKRKQHENDLGLFTGFATFETPMERDRAVQLLNNQKDGSNYIVKVEKFDPSKKNTSARNA